MGTLGMHYTWLIFLTSLTILIGHKEDLCLHQHSILNIIEMFQLVIIFLEQQKIIKMPQNLATQG